MATTLTVEVDPSTIVQVTSIDSVTATLPGGDEVLVEMVGNIRVTNLNRGKSVLKKELFAWLESSIMTARFGISTVQVSFTKCGRFAMVISRSKPGTFGLRLATFGVRLATLLAGSRQPRDHNASQRRGTSARLTATSSNPFTLSRRCTVRTFSSGSPGPTRTDRMGSVRVAGSVP